jgi:hypothetical protein
MTQKTKKSEHAFRPDHEVLSDIERTGRMMEEPAGLDLDAIVKQSAQAYHMARHDRMAEVFDGGSTMHWQAIRRLSTWREFWADWLAVSMFVVLFAVVALVRYGVITTTNAVTFSARAEWFVPAILMVATISAGCAWLYRQGTARRVAGAIAGAAFLTASVGGFYRSVGTLDTAAALASTELQNASLRRMLLRQTTGEFTTLSVNRGGFSLLTQTMSSDRATYYAAIKGLPLQVVANVSPSSGTVRWNDSKQSYESKLFSGTVKEVTPDALVIEDASGQTLRVKRGDAPLPSLRVGSVVVGAYDARTQEALAVIQGPQPAP